ncbi:MAG TPA: DegT/DnrJ/EryC1/StrS family aminotransferase [Acidimicrobiales bacterium]|nr:DegT/DnrJ/EryC1/StrS family aminotransferase [Acidimicrobiales bacterium]
MVPVVDLSRRAAALRTPFLAAVDAILGSGQVLLGPNLAAFEREYAAWTGQARAVGVSSGAAALQLGLQAMGVGAGDEVIVPAFTAVPTASAVAALGAVPVPVDVLADTAALDPAKIEAATTEWTAAVVLVHLYGRPAEVPDTPVPVLEDAAQAHGALGAGRRGQAVAYSFYPTKNLGGMGDGGAVVTEDEELAARVARLRSHGMAEQYVHVEVSQNFRMSEMEAAWLRLALPGLDAANDRRRAIAAAYRGAAPQLRWQLDHPNHVHHAAVFRTEKRQQVRDELAGHDVATAVHYPLALTQQPAYQALTREPCPEAEAWARECVTVPCFPEMTDDEVEVVAAALASLPAR